MITHDEVEMMSPKGSPLSTFQEDVSVADVFVRYLDVYPSLWSPSRPTPKGDPFLQNAIQKAYFIRIPAPMRTIHVSSHIPIGWIGSVSHSLSRNTDLPMALEGPLHSEPTIQFEGYKVCIGPQLVPQDPSIVGVHIDGIVMGIGIGIYTGVLETEHTILESQWICPDTPPCISPSICPVVLSDAFRGDIVYEKRTVELDIPERSYHQIDSHSHIISITQIVFVRSEEHDREKVSQLQIPLPIYHQLIESDLPPSSQS
jgi:hypothetical protein